MARLIAIQIEDDEVAVHAATTIAGYVTLCGLDGGVSGDDQHEVSVPRGAKIDCPTCWQIVAEAKLFRTRDFAASVRHPQ